MSIKPAALKKGDTIGVMAPSSVIDKGDLDKGIAILKKLGFQVHVHPQTYFRNKSLAGTDEQKVKALHELFADRNIKAVMAATGGNCALDYLHQIDYDLIKRNPKVLLGFSDVTALLHAFNAKAGLVTYHGPVLKWIHKVKDPVFTFDLLAGKKLAYPMDKTTILQPGIATGNLVGGNLALLTALHGTGYLADLQGAILYIEDIAEEKSRLARAFSSLLKKGVFDNISGLMLGNFKLAKDTGRPFGFTFEETVRKYTDDLGIPVVMTAPFGHRNLLYTMPVGSEAKLTVRGKTVSLKLTEPAVKI